METLKKYWMWIVGILAVWFLFFKRKAIRRRYKKVRNRRSKYGRKTFGKNEYIGYSSSAPAQKRKMRKMAALRLKMRRTKRRR